RASIAQTGNTGDRRRRCIARRVRLAMVQVSRRVGRTEAGLVLGLSTQRSGPRDGNHLSQQFVPTTLRQSGRREESLSQLFDGGIAHSANQFVASSHADRGRGAVAHFGSVGSRGLANSAKVDRYSRDLEDLARRKPRLQGGRAALVLLE